VCNESGFFIHVRLIALIIEEGGGEKKKRGKGGTRFGWYSARSIGSEAKQCGAVVTCSVEGVSPYSCVHVHVAAAVAARCAGVRLFMRVD